jgi:hypothetical protein
MKDVINRLRASNAKFVSEEYESGYGPGERWARNSAEVAEFKQLEDWRSVAGGEWDESFSDEDGSAYSVAEHFVFKVRPDDDGDRTAARDFWKEQDFEIEDCNAEFVRGFAEGALRVWDKVKDEI